MKFSPKQWETMHDLSNGPIDTNEVHLATMSSLMANSLATIDPKRHVLKKTPLLTVTLRLRDAMPADFYETMAKNRELRQARLGVPQTKAQRSKKTGTIWDNMPDWGSR